MKRGKTALKSVARRASSPEARFYAFVAFFIIVFLTGGGSRDDVQSLLLLRPIAILACAYSLTVKATQEWKGRMFPLYIAALLLGLMLLQLIPLPPSVWTNLPGRQIFADIARIADIEISWRPFTLSPSKTLNSLFSLAVPVAGMMLYLNLYPNYRNQSISVILVLCAVSALFGVLQMTGPDRGPLYLYRITNFESGVGLFANRNHQAALLSVCIGMLGWYVASLKPADRFSQFKFLVGIATIFVFIPLIFVTGSRAGFLLMIPSLLLVLFFLYFGRGIDKNSAGAKHARLPIRSIAPARPLMLAGGLMSVFGIAAMSVFFSRSLAFDRLFGSTELNELRVQLFPTLIRMVQDYLPWGSGFGTFEYVYKIYEPQELLAPNYLNQAHNDWLQFFIEGGIPAALIVALAVCWFAGRHVQLVRYWRYSANSKYTAVMASSAILLYGVASAGDYPLRVPSIIVVFGVLAGIFGDSVRDVQRSKNKKAGIAKK